MEYFGGSLCEVWQNVTIVGHKKNTYTLWVTRSERAANITEGPFSPVHYEMMGYNTLLGSHYDKYLVDYKDFSTHVDPTIFTLPEGLCFVAKRQRLAEGAALCSLFLLIGMTCGGFPGPGVEHHLLANPMKDLIHTSASGHSQRMFGHFKEKFQRRYEDDKEHELRQQTFIHNLR